MKTTNRLAVLFIALCAAAPGIGAGARSVQGEPELPNIIVIVLDAARWDCISLAEGADNATPELEKLAAGAYVFTNAYSPSDYTLPGHFSLFTGLQNLYDPADGKTRYDVEENSIVYQLKALGYLTIGVSANGVLTRKTSRLRYLKPFEAYYNFWEERPASWIAENHLERVMTVLERFEAPPTSRSALIIMSDAEYVVEVVDRILPETREAPLFLFINFMEPHDPYFPPEGFYSIEDEPALADFHSDIVTRPIPPWDTLVTDEKELAELRSRTKQLPYQWLCSVDLSEAHLARYKARYKGCIRYLDSQVGRLFQILRGCGVLENSIVIITADHGEAFGEDGFISHNLGNRYAYEATHRVPLILIPQTKTLEARREIHEKVSIADVVPTLHDILGITYDTAIVSKDPGNSYGRSLARLIEDHCHLHTGNGQFAMKKIPEGQTQTDAELEERLKAMGYLR